MLSGPIVGALANKFGCRAVAISGSLLATAAFFASTFSPTVEVLILTYGALGGDDSLIAINNNFITCIRTRNNEPNQLIKSTDLVRCSVCVWIWGEMSPQFKNKSADSANYTFSSLADHL